MSPTEINGLKSLHQALGKRDEDRTTSSGWILCDLDQGVSGSIVGTDALKSWRKLHTYSTGLACRYWGHQRKEGKAAAVREKHWSEHCYHRFLLIFCFKEKLVKPLKRTQETNTPFLDVYQSIEPTTFQADIKIFHIRCPHLVKVWFRHQYLVGYV